MKTEIVECGSEVEEKCGVAVLITCHNRKDKTIACISHLFQCALPPKVSLTVILVDDGSIDGTEHAIAQRFPQVRIIKGDGSLFWNRGMHLAFAEAMKEGFDYYLWLNDDTIIYSQALESAFHTTLADSKEKNIVVGATCDPLSGKMTYGGARRQYSLIRPFNYEWVYPNGTPQQLDIMNGNFVLIPDSIARKLENLDPIFEHAMGDTDYALRARKLGINILLTPTYIGQCARDEIKGSFRDRTLSLRLRTQLAFSRKGKPWRSWLRICCRHGGWLWPLHFIASYVKIIFFR